VFLQIGQQHLARQQQFILPQELGKSQVAVHRQQLRFGKQVRR
jgi:hypothetical protein